MAVSPKQRVIFTKGLQYALYFIVSNVLSLIRQRIVRKFRVTKNGGRS